MSKEREYFPFFLDFKIAFINLSKRDQANLIMSMIDYAENGKVPVKPSKNLEYSFEYVKNRLDKSLAKSKTASKNGSKGGRPPKKEVKKKVAKSTELAPNDNFQDFWTHYTPIKIKDGTSVSKGSKQEASKAYSKLIQEGISHEIIMKGLESYLTQCRVNNSYTLHAVRFLNKRLFEIEEEVVVESTKPETSAEKWFREKKLELAQEDNNLKTIETIVTIES
jgi:hypothetical protein